MEHSESVRVDEEKEEEEEKEEREEFVPKE